MKKTVLFFLVFFSLAAIKAQTFSAVVNQTIPDNGPTIYFDIAVSGLPGAIDQFFGVDQVCLNMTHTYDSDMDVKLKAPDGTLVTLFSSVGGDQDNFTNTCLAGTGTPVASGAAPFTGAYKSMGVLGNVNNTQDPNGMWQLVCTDMAGADVGFLMSWSITFSSTPALPFIFFSSNLPIVKLTTLAAAINDGLKVPVLMQIVDHGPGITNYVSDTVYSYSGTILTEWQGYSGPSYPKKNYDFDLVDSLGVKIDAPLIGMAPENDWIFKAEYLDHSLMKNAVAYEFARRMGNYAPHTRPCEIVLDGQYIGFYSLTEKVKRGANRVDIAKLTATDTAGSELTGGYIIEMNINGDPGAWNSVYPPINNATCGFPVEFKYVYPKAANIVTAQQTYIKNYVDTFENVLNGPNYLSSDSGYRHYADVRSFIDFLIVNEYSVNYDSYGRSTYMYKEKNTDGGKLNIGPPWDYDRAMPYDNPGSSSGWVWQITHPYWPFPFWWSKMWTDPDYRKQLACRWTTLRENTLRTDSFMVYIDTLSAYIHQAAVRNFTVWNDLGAQTYDDQVDSLKSYMTRRLGWIDTTLAVENVSDPLVYIPTDTLMCKGSLYDASFNGSQYLYNWQPGPDTSLIALNHPGSYTLIVSDVHGCYSSRTMNVDLSIPDANFNSASSGNLLSYIFTPVNSGGTAYSWDFGDGQHSAIQMPTHSYSADGNYNVNLTVTDSIGCSESSLIVLHASSVGIAKISDINASISPNPFADKILIHFEKQVSGQVDVSLANLLGQKMISQQFNDVNQNISISPDALSSGIYFVQIRSGSGLWTVKVVKE